MPDLLPLTGANVFSPNKIHLNALIHLLSLPRYCPLKFLYALLASDMPSSS
jgi:hypothetical protein